LADNQKDVQVRNQTERKPILTQGLNEMTFVYTWLLFPAESLLSINPKRNISPDLQIGEVAVTITGYKNIKKVWCVKFGETAAVFCRHPSCSILMLFAGSLVCWI
jgi:hypothetical protein